MRTLDGGLHWQTISADLTGATLTKAGPKPADAPTLDNAKQRGYGVIYTIAPSPLSALEIWAGSDTGLIHLTRNGGKTWSDVTPPGISAWSKITHIEVSHFSRGEAYAAVDRHRLDDMRPYLYRTRDFGKTWKPIVTGIADYSFLNAIREDPKRKGLLLAGTEFGVCVSFNSGDQWYPLQLNLPVTSVRDLVIHDNDLVIATHGRSFWILDNISPLRQLDEKVAGSDYWFYKPGGAVRMTSDNFLGTPLPADEPQAENPARGAYLDYYLRNRAAGEVTLQISDARGNVIRRYSSGDKPPRTPQDVAIAPRWFPKPQELSEEPGLHRFVWDLRFGRTGEKTAGEDDDEGDQRWLGPLILPGVYRAKLTVNGHELSQPIEVTMDPRSRATHADLIQQFQWAQRAFSDMIRAKRAVLEMNALQKQLTKIQTQIPPSEAALSRSLTTAASNVNKILSGGNLESEAGLQSVSDDLTKALNALESADRTPPSQVIQLYRESAKELVPKLAAWSAAKQQLIPALNQQLRNANLPAVQISQIEGEAEETLAR
ncbi:MAG: hypothetical protein JOZ62_03815 [Acidobacteriaceae bacterium]|nr:hypothetical protein [Acidobacteriaceae bacterium]